MDAIRIKSGIVIEVNDNGDTITINAEDQNFIDRFMNLQEMLDKSAKEMKNPALKDKGEHENIHLLIEKTKEIMSGIDELFGEGACRKIFGNIIPSPYLIGDFFEQITPIVRKYVDDRQKKIAEKYSNNRKGSRNKSRNKNWNQYRTKEELIQHMR